MRIKGPPHNLTDLPSPKNDPCSSTKAIAPSVKELLRVASKAEKATRTPASLANIGTICAVKGWGKPSKGATWLDGTLTRRQVRLVQEQSR